MKFTVVGTIQGRPARITWDNGQLTGDPVAIQLLRIEAELADGEDIGPVEGPYVYKNHLADPVATYFLLCRVFTTVDAITGDPFPERPPIPPGAIG